MLTRDDEHVYRWDGKPVPGVTELLSLLKDFAGISAEVLAAAGERGTDVHTACEFDDKGTLDEDTLTDEVWPYLEAYRLFKREHKPEILANEQFVYHPLFRYAGQLDRVLGFKFASYPFDAWTVDLKTTLKLNDVMGLQLAGYDMAFGPNNGKRGRAILHLLRDGTYKFVTFQDPNDARMFTSLITIYNWRKEHKCPN